MKTILQNGPCHGERWTVGEYCRVLGRHPQGQRERYRHSGQIDAATGCVIFVYAPRRAKA